MTTIFKELCLDSTRDDDVTARFWAAVTGCRVRSDPGSPVGDVVGDQEGMGIAICPVPEPKVVKNRVHLDIEAASLTDVVDRGATVLAQRSRWTVCADPEGNEFCVFVRAEPVAGYRTSALVVDSVAPRAVAQWWADVFGVATYNDGQPGWWLTGVPGMPFSMVFAPVPEPKVTKNRLHWDVFGDPEQLVGRGAVRLWDQPRWSVLADPEGNEFCVFPPRLRRFDSGDPTFARRVDDYLTDLGAELPPD